MTVVLHRSDSERYQVVQAVFLIHFDGTLVSNQGMRHNQEHFSTCTMGNWQGYQNMRRISKYEELLRCIWLVLYNLSPNTYLYINQSPKLSYMLGTITIDSFQVWEGFYLLATQSPIMYLACIILNWAH